MLPPRPLLRGLLEGHLCPLTLLTFMDNSGNPYWVLAVFGPPRQAAKASVIYECSSSVCVARISWGEFWRLRLAPGLTLKKLAVERLGVWG